jgi:hypothetical protein
MSRVLIPRGFPTVGIAAAPYGTLPARLGIITTKRSFDLMRLSLNLAFSLLRSIIPVFHPSCKSYMKPVSNCLLLQIPASASASSNKAESRFETAGNESFLINCPDWDGFNKNE